MPAVTVFSKPKGAPIATTHSPTSSEDGSPIVTTGRSVASIFSTATSLFSSAPSTRAANSRRSVSFTVTRSAPSTTWALVRITPSALTMNPEPSPRTAGSPSGIMGRPK